MNFLVFIKKGYFSLSHCVLYALKVDWYPWGEEAFAEARKRDVPIFLSSEFILDLNVLFSYHIKVNALKYNLCLSICLLVMNDICFFI